MGASRVTFDMFLKRAKAIHGNKYDYSKVNWVNTKTKVEIVCPIHGSFYQKPYKHLEGQGCPDCCKNATVTQDMFIARAKSIHGENTYDYSRVQYKNMWTPIEIICPIHGSFFQMPAKHVKIGKYAAQGCPDCRYIRQRQTNEERYGVDNPMKYREFLETNWEMRKKNGTCNTSKVEEQMYAELVTVFGKKMVKRNYNKDYRYPFYCDFYIVSHDIFIELNGTWFHGPHAFDATNIDDVHLLDTWEKKIADENGLNYFVFWDNDLSDFHIWLENYNHTETNHTTEMVVN